MGMGQNILKQNPSVKKIFAEASEAIGSDIEKLCFEGPQEQLQLTENTQPTILTVSIAMYEIMRNQCEFSGFAGHSLGEYSALVASGRLKFFDAVKLVHARGKFMQSAVPVGVGAMSAVLCSDVEKIKAVCLQCTTDSESVEIVNFNTPQQFVIAGHLSAVEKVEQQLRSERIKSVRLPVSAPFHSRLMKNARLQMQPLIEATSFTSQTSTIIPNINAELITNYDKRFLTQQIDSPVLWTQTITHAVEAGFKKFVEVGPGKVLQGLFKKNVQDESLIVEGVDLQ